jgi:uncharacterized protein YfaS (alpha-2-macroglobulin family)
VWAWDENVTEYAYRYPALEALADRDHYAPGDTVRVLVNSDVKGAQVLATLEGRDLYDVRTVRLTGGTGLVTFPVTADFAPNAFVTVNVRKGPRGEHAHARGRDRRRAPRSRDHAEARPRTVRAGDSARIDVETRDARGEPVAAEVSVAVVDEAIFSLRADATPDPHDVFYGRNPTG